MSEDEYCIASEQGTNRAWAVWTKFMDGFWPGMERTRWPRIRAGLLYWFARLLGLRDFLDYSWMQSERDRCETLKVIREL